MTEEVTFAAPWYAAVVQAPLYGVHDDATAKRTQFANAKRIAEEIDRIVQMASPSPRLLVYPVLCLTGPSRFLKGVKMETVAVELPGDEFRPIVDACRRNNCYFVSTTQEKVSQFPGQYYHTGFILGPNGVVLRSPKAQAFSAPEVTSLRDIYDEYEAVFGLGSVLPVAKTDIGTLGCLVEAELHVPEATRLLRAKGAEIIVHPTVEHGPGDRGPALAMKQTAAYTSGVYWLSSCPSRFQGYPDQTDWIGGTSSITGPDGVVDALVGPQGEGIAIGKIDPERLRDARRKQSRDTTPANILYRDLYR